MKGTKIRVNYGKRGKLLRYVGPLHCSSTGAPDRGIHVGECWSIARRCIAIAMDQGGSIKIAYMEVAGGAPSVRRPGGRAPKVGAFRRRREQLPRAARFFLNSFRHKL